MAIRIGHAVASLALATALPFVAAAQDSDTVIAKVGEHEITLGHMIVLRERLPEQYQQLDDQTLYDGLLEQLVQQSALAATSGALTPRAELVVENERRGQMAAQAIETGVAAAITEEAVQALYDERYDAADAGVEYNASHILLESEEDARAVIEDLEGGAAFEEIARERSVGPSGPSGGELGWFGAGAMVPSFDERVQSMDVGGVSEPVQTQFGWHVIRLNETRPVEAPTIESVRDQLAAEIRQREIERIVDEAVQNAEVEIVAQDVDPAIVRDDRLIGD